MEASLNMDAEGVVSSSLAALFHKILFSITGAELSILYIPAPSSAVFSVNVLFVISGDDS